VHAHLNTIPWVHLTHYPKRHKLIDRFSRFCTAEATFSPYVSLHYTTVLLSQPVLPVFPTSVQQLKNIKKLRFCILKKHAKTLTTLKKRTYSFRDQTDRAKVGYRTNKQPRCRLEMVRITFSDLRMNYRSRHLLSRSLTKVVNSFRKTAGSTDFIC